MTRVQDWMKVKWKFWKKWNNHNYWVDERNEQVIFFGIRKDEFNTVTVESQLQKRMNRPVRALYNEESLLKENQMTVPYKKYGYEQVFSGVDE